MVPTYADDPGHGGELASAAASLAADARELLRLAVAYERRRGTSWDALGAALGLNSRQAVHDRYGEVVKQLDDVLTESWLLGGDPRFAGAPEGLTDTAEAASRLDRWVADHVAGHGPLARKPADDPDRVRPVSGHLEPLDAWEHSALVTAAAALIAERSGQYGPADVSVRHLERGLARRKVELYERLLADDLAGEVIGTDADQTRDLLAVARARLAALEREL